jgi:hypothetical protein
MEGVTEANSKTPSYTNNRLFGKLDFSSTPSTLRAGTLQKLVDKN